MAKFLFVASILEKTMTPEVRISQIDNEGGAGRYRVISHEVKGPDSLKTIFALLLKAKDLNKASELFTRYMDTKTIIPISKLEKTVRMIPIEDMTVVDNSKVNIKEIW